MTEETDPWEEADRLEQDILDENDRESPQYPAKYICHWPTGPVPVCDHHARSLRGLAGFMGAHVAFTPADEGQTCTNCENEAKKDG